jgi:hypothetical protein
VTSDAPKASLSEQLLLELLSDVSGLRSQISNVQGQNNMIIAEQQRAAEGRVQLYDRMRVLEEAAGTVKRIAPLVDKHETRHNETSGAMSFGRTLWAAFGGGIGAALAFLFHWLTSVGRLP